MNKVWYIILQRFTQFYKGRLARIPLYRIKVAAKLYDRLYSNRKMGDAKHRRKNY